ncbi:hypothetical protein ACFFF5_19015 [Lederbergia wuyishanensis]|uniref:Uncharacterized protein n=1 Tax=Lederbergia wuyishanensis TaxID=1347903 RepID=A0ABU0D5H2_9BACI|nr:hypothetical protein [Lederbergia wuyishanensis]MCJ8009796.1 hypothetical protein [Lederbergia wuyishanensis]MDQ0343652.1 hypothetical protein [Lederbergia wuyishanensis]
MEMAKEIIGMLHEIKDTLNEHSTILNEHSNILNEHSVILNEHSTILREHSQILNDHSQKLDMHSETLQEHGLVLRGLRNGQEMLKAELSEMRLQNAREFGEIKEQMKDMGDSIDILKEYTWDNKKDILRIKKTMGMA